MTQRKISIQDWGKYFPFKEPRKQQETIINEILNSFYYDKMQTFVVEAGLGIGKSAIAATVARYVQDHPFDDDENFENGSYILTSQKILQDQYIKDFGKLPCEMKNIISSANFNCVGRPGAKCSDSLRVYSALGNRFPAGPRESCRKSCPYKKQKQQFMDGSIGVTNYSYFLSETYYSGQLKPRRLLVIDEAHNIESNLVKFIEVKISKKFCEAVLGIKFYSGEFNVSEIVKWISKKYEPAIKKTIKKMVEDMKNLEDETKLLSISEKHELLDKHICKIHRMQGTWDEKNWVIKEEKDDKGNITYIFKPIDISAWTDDILLDKGQKRLLLSATILDHDFYYKSIGLKKEKTSSISIDSPFEIKNKPIFYIPVGKMSYSNIDATLFKMAEMVEEILRTHGDEKGIIHAGNFKIVDFLNSLGNKRLLIQKRGMSRDDLIEQHVKSKHPTVLVSPSMTEGVDLKNDLSRFQIFCKIPFPSLADDAIKKRSEKDEKYYPYVTAQSIIQATGRSIRNEEDWAITYILDECADFFFKRNKKLFPKSFVDSITDVNGRKVF